MMKYKNNDQNANLNILNNDDDTNDLTIVWHEHIWS